MDKSKSKGELKVTYVAQDQIWRDHIRSCNYTTKKWPELWGFLSQTSELNEFRKSKTMLDLKSNTGAGTSVYGNETSKVVDNDTASHYSTGAYARSASPRKVPMTASAMIGWRSTDKETQLEKYGGYARGRQSITRSFNWPYEAI